MQWNQALPIDALKQLQEFGAAHGIEHRHVVDLAQKDRTKFRVSVSRLRCRAIPARKSTRRASALPYLARTGTRAFFEA
jgi:hypothetical protein